MLLAASILAFELRKNMSFKKIDKEFTLGSSKVNAYGYRLLTKGYLSAEFLKNPIGYYMHGTSKEYPREMGVLVRWEDMRLDGDLIKAKPCINLLHPRGEKTVAEIESGFLNAASMGSFVVEDVSTDPADYEANQTGPTISKWYNRECSLVDMPGNYDALTELYDAQNNPLSLAELAFPFKKDTMKQVMLTAEQLGLLNLSADATADAVSMALKNLVAEAGKVPALTADLVAEKTAHAGNKKELEDLKASTLTGKVSDLVAKGLTEGRITAAAGEELKKQYASNPEGLQTLLAQLPVYKTITGQLTGDTLPGDKLAALMAKGWDELDKAGELPALKAADLDAFKTKFKNKFGTDYRG